MRVCWQKLSLLLLIPYLARGEKAMLERHRRGFRSYFYNYLDEIAMSICSAIPADGPGLIYAVRRTCGDKDDCRKICTDPKLREQGPKEVQQLTWNCTESLHVYKRQPSLADNYDNYTDSRKLGLAVFRHHSCTVVGCGPNYCCCRAVAL
ncbi:uncharacterized protein LOC116611361 isoform X1 [Nematostella vectensis]|uniref:uncharacterized protein LOC116611361 isoform X1 n=2 Tax=Nematostella vectensis TaxID=45351 RepID=UPI002076F54C|nr:uncharacterized protein LOC116611361 isoform X1 [Nematostella vectensis]